MQLQASTPPNPHPHPRPRPNLDSQGADIDSIFGVETASACYQRCEEHESCLAYTYVKSEHVCWLKGEGYTSKPNPNTVSGATLTPTPALPLLLPRPLPLPLTR